MKNGILIMLAIVVVSCTDNKEVELDCELTDLELIVSGNDDADCNLGATIELEASGGEAPYLYSFDGSPLQDLTTFDGIALGGPFEAIVQDANGCRLNEEIMITGDENTVTFDAKTSLAGCGGSEGEIIVEASGGEGDYKYKIDDATFGDIREFSGLETGTYTVSVKDGAGCINVQGIQVKSGISYDTGVKPIIVGSCAVSGCHVSGTGRSDLANFNTVQQRAAAIKSRVVSGDMPPENDLTEEEIQAIVCWVEDGAINN